MLLENNLNLSKATTNRQLVGVDHDEEREECK